MSPALPALILLAGSGLMVLDAPPDVKSPDAKALTAITERGRLLAGYDRAAWHASDAVQKRRTPIAGIERYIAREQTAGRWVVSFGRLDAGGNTFLLAAEATQGATPDAFTIKTFDPPRHEAGFVSAAARAVDTALKTFTETFDGERRPYNVAVIPADRGTFWVYLTPAPTKPGIWPIGGDVRFKVSADGATIVETRRLHKAVIETEPPKNQDQKQVMGFHTHILDDTPEDTDVFYVLTRRPHVPELVSTPKFVFKVEADGTITPLGTPDEVFKKRKQVR